VFNYPNFDQPVVDIANPSQFGTIISAVNTPTMILGLFLAETLR
jgi:hypothetical protein